MSIRLMADTTDHAAPAGYDLYAGYDDGLYQSYPYLKQEFPDKPVLRITVFAHDVFGDALDVETGDATPSQAPGWVKAQGKTQFRIWVADYGVPHCPFAGASAWQKIDHGPHGENIDVSEVYADGFGTDGVPVIYCPFSELQAVLNACSAAGLTLVTPGAQPVPTPTPGPVPGPTPTPEGDMVCIFQYGNGLYVGVLGAWRKHIPTPGVFYELVRHGTPVNATDGTATVQQDVFDATPPLGTVNSD